MTAAAAIGIAVIFVWLGIALAISFVDAPLKFQAPEVTTRIGFANRSVVYRGGGGDV